MLLLCPRPGRGAELVEYSVVLQPSGEAAVDDAASQSAGLVQSQAAGAVSPALLIARAHDDAGRLDDAMRSLGHYAGQTSITIAGRALDDPDLPDALDAWPTGQAVPVGIALAPGKQFTLRNIHVVGDAAGLALDLPPGSPAVAAKVLDAGARLLRQLQAGGHALARVEPPIADPDLAAAALDVTFAVQAGPRVAIGRIDISGQGRLQESYLRRRLKLTSGAIYDPAALEAARTDLASVPAIASVRLTPGSMVDPDGTLPVDVAVVERKPHVASVTAAYSTDQGANASTSWTHRDLFGRAEELTLSAGIDQIGGSAARQPGYHLSSQLDVPDWRQRDQSWRFTLLAVRESLEAYDRVALIGGATFTRRIAAHWTASVGLFGSEAHFVQDKVGRDYTLAQMPVGLHYDTTTSLTDAATGTRADATITPSESLSRRNASFTLAQIGAAQFFDLTAPGRSVLALRALVGSVAGASVADVPPDQRFYGGGSTTIRGYRFQSVGPRLGNGQPGGGAALAAGTVEFRQRFGADWGGVVFMDAGQVSGQALPFTGHFHAGAGMGVRYYTSIGPIRADIAMPLIHQSGSDAVEVYLGLGQAF
jgi:translocation and assembly module TamA